MFCRLFLLCMLLAATVGCSARRHPYFGETSSYTVRKGDTLTAIAHQHACTIDQLVELNDLSDPNILEPGDALLVPTIGARERKNTKLSRAQPRTPEQYRGGQLEWPVGGGTLLSGFGPRDSGFHDGLDIAAETGTPVYAAHDGVVVYSDNELGGYGELVIVQSSSSLISIYAHNAKRFVRAGDKVKRGQLISEVGATGRASGPHLHFEVRVKDKNGQFAAVDPAPLLKSNKRPSLRYRINESLSPLIAKLSQR
jgi:murein DD-endopeptidase MepM/ murein hydrolase activator NlpD